jgi:hypothetical protein
MTNWRLPLRRMLFAAALPFGFSFVVLNVASALGASESSKDVIVMAGIAGMLLAPAIVALRASKDPDRR